MANKFDFGFNHATEQAILNRIAMYLDWAPGVINEPNAIAVANPDGTKVGSGLLIIDEMESATGWTAVGDASNIATSTTHLVGTKSMSWDKAGGTDVVSGIQKTLTPAVDLGTVGATQHRVFWFLNFGAVANVATAWIRLGTDASNYDQWSIPVASLVVGWNVILTPLLADPSWTQVGTGLNTSAVTYIAVGYTTALAADVLAATKADCVSTKQFVDSMVLDPTGAGLALEATALLSEAHLGSIDTTVATLGTEATLALVATEATTAKEATLALVATEATTAKEATLALVATEATVSTLATEATTAKEATLALVATEATTAKEATLALVATEATVATLATEATTAKEATLALVATEATVATLATEATTAKEATLALVATEATTAKEATLALVATEATVATLATEATTAKEATLALVATEATVSTLATEATVATLATEATLSALNPSVKLQDGAGVPLTSGLVGAEQALGIRVLDAAGNQVTAFTSDLLKESGGNEVIWFGGPYGEWPLLGVELGNLVSKDDTIGGITGTARDAMPLAATYQTAPADAVDGRYTRLLTDIKGRLLVATENGAGAVESGGNLDTLASVDFATESTLADVSSSVANIEKPVCDHDQVDVTQGAQIGARYEAALSSVTTDGDFSLLKTDIKGRLHVTADQLTDATQKTQIVDGAGNVVGAATGNALDVRIKSDAASLATSALQGTGNTSLGNIDTNTGNLQNTHAAHDAAAPSQVLLLGAKWESSPTNVSTTGDITVLKATQAGKLLTTTIDPSTYWVYNVETGAALVNTVVKAAPGAGLKIRILGYKFSADGTVDIRFEDEDDTLVVSRSYMTAKKDVVVTNCDIRVTVNKQLEVDSSAAVNHTVSVWGDIVSS